MVTMADVLCSLREATLCRAGWHCRAGKRVRKFDGGKCPELCRYCRLIVGNWRPKRKYAYYSALCRQDGDWWVITVPELKDGNVTQARTLDEIPSTVTGLVAIMTGIDPGIIRMVIRVTIVIIPE